MNKNYDIIVVGAGIVGCSIALALCKRGLKTLNVDSLPASGYGSTSHSSAIIRPVYSHTTSCAIAHESRYYWKNWQAFLDVEDERGFANYTECGGLVLIREGEEFLYQDNLTAMNEVGVGYEMLDGRDISALYPGISLESYGPPCRNDYDHFGLPTGGAITGGILVAEAGYVSDPQLATHNMQMAAEKHGAIFRFNAKLHNFLQPADKVSGITLESGEKIQAEIVINATGPHSSMINQLAGISATLKIKTRAVRHEVVYLPSSNKHFRNGNRFVVDTDAGFYHRPDGEDLLIGTTDPACDPMDIADPDNYNTSFTEQWTLQAYRCAQRFPELGIPNTARGTVGLYDVSDDWIPIYDKSDLDGYYLAIGTSGNQFKNAPLIGEILAEIVVAGAEGINHDEHPASLHLAQINRSVGLEFYSRNREIQKTNSVMA